MRHTHTTPPPSGATIISAARLNLDAARWQRIALIGFIVAQVALILYTRRFLAGADGGDLCRDYLDAHRLLNGQDPYAPFAGCADLHHSPHPPLALLMLVPLAFLSIGAAGLVWDLLMLAALVGALVLIWRELAITMPTRWIIGGLIMLGTWAPLHNTWLEAQVGPLMLLLLALAWRARRRGQPVAAGIWLALATLLRLYPALLFIYPIIRREWRLTVSGIVSGLVVTLLTLPFIGPGEYLAYFLREAPGSSAEWINDAHNVSLRGWLGQLFIGSNTIHPLAALPGIVTPLYILGTLALLAALLWQAWQARLAPLGGTTDDLMWMLGLPVMLLISPLAWPHYFIVLILPLLVAGAYLWRTHTWDRAATLLIISVALLDVAQIGLQALYPVPRLLPWPAAVFVFALPFYALALLGYALWRLLTRTTPAAA